MNVLLRIHSPRASVRAFSQTVRDRYAKIRRGSSVYHEECLRELLIPPHRQNTQHAVTPHLPAHTDASPLSDRHPLQTLVVVTRDVLTANSRGTSDVSQMCACARGGPGNNTCVAAMLPGVAPGDFVAPPVFHVPAGQDGKTVLSHKGLCVFCFLLDDEDPDSHARRVRFPFGVDGGFSKAYAVETERGFTLDVMRIKDLFWVRGNDAYMLNTSLMWYVNASTSITPVYAQITPSRPTLVLPGASKAHPPLRTAIQEALVTGGLGVYMQDLRRLCETWSFDKCAPASIDAPPPLPANSRKYDDALRVISGLHGLVEDEDTPDHLRERILAVLDAHLLYLVALSTQEDAAGLTPWSCIPYATQVFVHLARIVYTDNTNRECCVPVIKLLDGCDERSCSVSDASTTNSVLFAAYQTGGLVAAWDGRITLQARFDLQNTLPGKLLSTLYATGSGVGTVQKTAIAGALERGQRDHAQLLAGRRDVSMRADHRAIFDKRLTDQRRRMLSMLSPGFQCEQPGMRPAQPTDPLPLLPGLTHERQVITLLARFGNPKKEYKTEDNKKLPAPRYTYRPQLLARLMTLHSSPTLSLPALMTAGASRDMLQRTIDLLNAQDVLLPADFARATAAFRPSSVYAHVLHLHKEVLQYAQDTGHQLTARAFSAYCESADTRLLECLEHVARCFSERTGPRKHVLAALRACATSAHDNALMSEYTSAALCYTRHSTTFMPETGDTPARTISAAEIPVCGHKSLGVCPHCSYVGFTSRGVGKGRQVINTDTRALVEESTEKMYCPHDCATTDVLGIPFSRVNAAVFNGKRRKRSKPGQQQQEKFDVSITSTGVYSANAGVVPSDTAKRLNITYCSTESCARGVEMSLETLRGIQHCCCVKTCVEPVVPAPPCPLSHGSRMSKVRGTYYAPYADLQDDGSYVCGWVFFCERCVTAPDVPWWAMMSKDAWMREIRERQTQKIYIECK